MLHDFWFLTAGKVFAICGLLFKTVNGHFSFSDLVYFYGGYQSNPYSKTILFKEFDARSIMFYLYTRQRPEGCRLYKKRQIIKISGFNRRNPTKIIIHGYLGDYTSASVQMPKNAYMSAGEFNVIAVDWSKYSFSYAVAINAVRGVGRTIREMIAFLNREGGLEVSDLHVIGYSLGAHIAGFSGTNVGGSKIARITGLDPASPAFTENPPNERLGFEDAQFVDVIHTSVRLLGMVKNIGHADFYPSGGMHQPRCPSGIIEEVTGKCDHKESFVYFAETIRNKHLYPARACENLQEALEERCTGEKSGYMGDAATRTSRGIYYVNVSHLIRGETSGFRLSSPT